MAKNFQQHVVCALRGGVHHALGFGLLSFDSLGELALLSGKPSALRFERLDKRGWCGRHSFLPLGSYGKGQATEALSKTLEP